MTWLKKWQVDIHKEQLSNEQEILNNLKLEYTKACEHVDELIKELGSKEQTQSVMYQKQFQENLKHQIDEITDNLYHFEYNSVNEYLKNSYEDGIIQSMYSLHKQGCNVTVPIDQNEIALMASKSEFTGFKLSDKLYSNVTEMAKTIRSEITRGLISELSYYDIARNISNRSMQSLNKCMRIARTEGHRVTMQSRMQAMATAKDKGADIVKQWDSTLDGNTRETHRMLDGQVRELDGQFSVGGHKASYPGGFGIASEDINCRCSMLEVPRWSLDDSDDVTKWDNKSGKLLMSQKEVDLWKDANKWTNGKGNKYNQFKKAYVKKAKAVSGEHELTKQEKEKINKLVKKKSELLDKLELQCDDELVFENIWKEPVTIKDWKDKQESIQLKLNYFKNKFYLTKDSKFEDLYGKTQMFNEYGKIYWEIMDKIEDIEKQIDMIKNPQIYKQIISGGSINQNCKWKTLFKNTNDADKYFRKWADEASYAMGDKNGQKALYLYTKGSGFMNRPLSGYQDSWSRYNFVGFDKIDLDCEGGKKSIDDLTKFIDKTEPLKEGIVLRRGSSKSGLIGLFEGAGVDYDTIESAMRDGNVTNFEGFTIKNHAFTSCGISNGAGFGGDVNYVIKCPAGTKMVYAEPQSRYGRTISGGKLYTPGMSYNGVGDEAEMILQRNTSFRIDKITHKGGYRYDIEMTVVDQDITKY